MYSVQELWCTHLIIQLSLWKWLFWKVFRSFSELLQANVGVISRTGSQFHILSYSLFTAYTVIQCCMCT